MNQSKTPEGDDTQPAASANPSRTSTASSAPPGTTVDKAAVRRRAVAALRGGRFDLITELFDRAELDLPALIENLHVYQAELEIQNEELRASEQRALTALARYTTLFGSLPVGVLLIDGFGLVLDANTQARNTFGLRDIRAHQHFLLRLVNPDDRDPVTRAIQQLDRRDGEVVTSVRLESDQSGRIQADLHFARLPTEAKDPAHAICAIVDQTESIRQRDALARANAQLEHSQERYRVLADFSPDWDYWMSPEGAYVYVSPACEEITGYSAEQFRADPNLFEHILHPDDRPAWQVHTRKMEGTTGEPAQRGQPEGHLHFRIRTRNGQERWIEHVCRAVNTPDGRHLGRRGVNRDITERQRAREALSRSEALLNATGRLAQVGGWELEREAGRLHWTQITRELHEVDEDFEPDMATALDFYHPDDRERIRGAVEAALSDGTPYTIEARLITAHGRTIWVKCTGEAIPDDDGWPRVLRGSLQDITARVEADAALRKSEGRYRALFESAGEGMVILQDGAFKSLNRAALTMLGYRDEREITGKRPVDISPATQPDGEPTEAKEQRLLGRCAAGEVRRFDWQHLRADGEPLTVQVTLISIALDDGDAMFAIWFDLSERRAAEQREERARAVFENTSEGIVITDPERRIVAVNPAFTEITGYSESEAIGKNPRILKSDRQGRDFYTAMWQSLEQTDRWRGEFWNRRKDGELYAQLSTISAVRDGDGRLTSYIGVFSDITHLKRTEQTLYELAHRDALTGLANRVLLNTRLDQALSRAGRNGQQVALMYLDLDLFKNVNDTLGHSVGDALLISVAAAMTRRLPRPESIARLGGDEFVVLLEDLGDPDEAADVAVRLLEVFSQPFQAEGRELHITASIGISLFPHDGEDMDTLLANADVAMYRAKEQGRNTYRFFDPRMTEGAVERLRLGNALRGALARGELTLHFQPQVRITDGCMNGAEVLLRWNHPEFGRVSPALFIPIAEELGLIAEFGAWVLHQACRQLAEWDRAGFPVPRLAVNLSVVQLERPSLVQDITEVLEVTGVAPDRLELEVTESMLMRHAEQVIANLRVLGDMGLSIAVDDFGSGFSSLAYLKRLPIHRLKIDKSFIEQLTEDHNDDAIARAIIALARGLGLDVIAEGVETETQADFLLREGCTEAQGFLYARPMPAGELFRSEPCFASRDETHTDRQ